MSVRISANDWVGDEGVTPAEAVEIARMFAAAGADIIDVSAGQTSTEAQPVYGRMFQTPFCDRIRNEAGMATMAVGNITEADQVNSILMAGRADLVCLAPPASGRPLLDAACCDPGWATPARPGPCPIWRARDQVRRLARTAAGGDPGMTLAGKRVLVTGGGSGAGADLARWALPKPGPRW